MNEQNYNAYPQVPSQKAKKEPISAISFLDDNGNQLYDKAIVQGLLNAKDENHQWILAKSIRKSL